MGRVDPHAVLGIEPGASPEEVTAAYRRLAKAHHPDRKGTDGKEIRDINAAYAMLRDSLAQGAPVRARQQTPRERSRPRGTWLPAAVRIALGPELLGALVQGEPVRLIATASAWDAHDIRLVLTDRRLVWLRDDALTDRVRFLALSEVEGWEARPGRRGRPGGLRIRLRDARRVEFSELRPEALAALDLALQPLAASADS